MKCDILAHEFNTAENGNRYCKLEVRQSGDEFGKTFNYVMFVTEAMEEALEAKFPKFIYLQEVRVKMPKPFYRVWETDGPGHSQGEFVTRPNREDPDNPIMIVFEDIKVIIRTMPDGTPARGEDAQKLAESSYYRGISMNTIVPIDAYDDGDNDNNIGATNTGADPYAGASTVGNGDLPETATDPAEQPTQQPAGRPTGRPGVTIRR